MTNHNARVSSQGTLFVRAILYARVSKDDRKNSTSGIEGQLEMCRAYAKERGYEVVGEYYEEPNCYTPGQEWLPALEKIMELAESRTFDVLVVREIDRLARNRFKQMSIENHLESLGMRIEYAKGQYEDTPEGNLLKGLMGEFAEYEANKINERMERGRIQATKLGKIIGGGTPLGYTLIDGHYVINEQEAEIVRHVFDLYTIHRKSQSAIVNYLNEHGMLKRGKKWTISALQYVLKNETYTGVRHYRKTKVIRDKRTGKKTVTIRPKHEWLSVKVPPIISMSQFAAVQAQLDRNKRLLGKNRRFQYLLGGMQKCAHCGSGVTGSTTIRDAYRWSYYACNALRAPKRYGFKCAEAKCFQVDDVDNAVWSWVKSLLLDKENLAKALAEYQAQQLSQYAPRIRLIESNKTKLNELIVRKERLIEAYTTGVIGLDDLATQKVGLDEEIALLENGITMIEAELSPKILSEEEISQIHQFSDRIAEGISIADNDFLTRRNVIELLQIQTELGVADGEKYVKVRCVLGENQLSTTTRFTNLPGT